MINGNTKMEHLKTLLEESLNIEFRSAVLSNPRSKDGIVKAKVRPILKKDVLFFQLETFRGNQAFHKNLNPEDACEEILNLMQELKQMQMEMKV